MKCPNCVAIDLLMTERKGIEIDYCPNCRGVWLDRGELDKFIQQADQQTPSLPPGRIPSTSHNFGDVASRYSDDDERRYRERSYDQPEFRGDDRQYHRNGKKRESFWGELFDFD